jgi:hypothetical protein
MKTRKLLSGEEIDLAVLDERDGAYLAQLSADAEGGADYFDLLRRVKGPDAFPLRGGRITAATARGPLYRAAHDIADRVGIAQGYLLAAEADPAAVKAEPEQLLSLTEAADSIGISRPAAHQALVEGRLAGQRVGNAWVVLRADVETFKRARARASGASVSDSVRVAARSR